MRASAASAGGSIYSIIRLTRGHPHLSLFSNQVYETVESIKSDYPSLRLGHGKCVYELRPDITWDKGKVRAAVRPWAVGRLLSLLTLASSDVMWTLSSPLLVFPLTHAHSIPTGHGVAPRGAGPPGGGTGGGGVHHLHRRRRDGRGRLPRAGAFALGGLVV